MKEVGMGIPSERFHSLITRSRAPTRLSFGGGGTDISPYMEKHGGLVLSTTIDRYAYCTVAKSDKWLIESNFASAGVDWFDRINEGPLSVSCFTEAPAGSGLGGSSSLMVAIIRALSTYYGEAMSNHEIAKAAWSVERMKLGIDGGYQDQFAAAYGGWNMMEFSDVVKVIPVPLREDLLRELLASLLLIDLGTSRVSSGIIKRQVKRYEQPETIEVLDNIKFITRQMLRALTWGELKEFGLLLSREWEQKKKLDRKISNRTIDRFHAGMLRQGAIGGKLLGAGEGGHMVFLSDLSKRKVLLDYIASSGFKHIPFRFDSQGVVAWTL